MKQNLILLTYSTILFLLVAAFNANAQCELSGLIIDEITSTPINSASILIKRTEIGTKSGVDGTYHLKLDCDSVTLIVSASGFENIEKRVFIGASQKMNFFLKRKKNLLPTTPLNDSIIGARYIDIDGDGDGVADGDISFDRDAFLASGGEIPSTPSPASPSPSPASASSPSPPDAPAPKSVPDARIAPSLPIPSKKSDEKLPTTTKWVKRHSDKNALSADPDDSMVWALVEVDASGKEIASPPDAPSPSKRSEESGKVKDFTTKSPTPKKYRPKQLTAGEIHDFSKWEMWQDISKNQLNQWQKVWNMTFSSRYTVQVMNKKGIPVVDSKVELFDDQTLLWTAKTDNTGKAELWANVFGEQTKDFKKLSIFVTQNNQKHKIKKVKEFKDGINFLKIKSACETHDIVDIAFVVDATGSMGDEINYLKAELEDVILQMQTKTNAKINLGSVFYRDKEDEYLTRKSLFSTEISTTINFINNQSAKDGGDRPEAVDAALDVAINEMNWSEKATARLLFLVLDAPPHELPEVLKKLESVTKKAAEKGIRIIPVTASGIDKSAEYLMRSLALCTNGTYTFLTNHSGIGNSHIEPTTDSYKVELFNDLLVRLFVQYTQTFDCESVEIDSLETFELKPMEVINSNSITSNDSIPIVVNCFPNPTKGQLTIETNKTFDEVFVTDANGKIVQRHLNIEIGNNTINLSQFPSGLYFLRYIKNGQSGTVKIVVIH